MSRALRSGVQWLRICSQNALIRLLSRYMLRLFAPREGPRRRVLSGFVSSCR
jgi:hypothetical protein